MSSIIRSDNNTHYTSDDEFDLDTKVQITNETPPFDIYENLNSVLKNDTWKWLLGYSETTFDLPYDGETDTNGDVIDGTQPVKIVNGTEATEYKAESYKEWNSDTNTYDTVKPDGTRLVINGAVMTENDLFLHEIYRYLSCIYPNHPDWLNLLTRNEILDAFNSAAAEVDYKPDNRFFELVADSITNSDSEKDIEEFKLNLRNLKDNSIRRKYYGSFVGYRMFASDIFRRSSIFPLGTCLPIKEATDEETASQYTIDTFNSNYQKKFRSIDYTGETKVLSFVKNASDSIQAYNLPGYERFVFEKLEGVSDLADNATVDDYLYDIFSDDRNVSGTCDSLTSYNTTNLSYGNKDGTLSTVSATDDEMIYGVALSRKFPRVYSSILVYKSFEDLLNLDGADFSKYVTDNSNMPYIDGNLYDTSYSFLRTFFKSGTGFEAADTYSNVKILYNTLVRGTLTLEADEMLPIYSDNPVPNTGSDSEDDPWLAETFDWPSSWGFSKGSYVSNAYAYDETQTEIDTYQVIGYSRGQIKVEGIPLGASKYSLYDLKDRSPWDVNDTSLLSNDGYGIIVKNSDSKYILLIGSLRVTNWDTTTISGYTRPANVTFNIKYIPTLKSPSAMTYIYGTEYTTAADAISDAKEAQVGLKTDSEKYLALQAIIDTNQATVDGFAANKELLVASDSYVNASGVTNTYKYSTIGVDSTVTAYVQVSGVTDDEATIVKVSALPETGTITAFSYGNISLVPLTKYDTKTTTLEVPTSTVKDVAITKDDLTYHFIGLDDAWYNAKRTDDGQLYSNILSSTEDLFIASESTTLKDEDTVTVNIETKIDLTSDDDDAAYTLSFISDDARNKFSSLTVGDTVNGAGITDGTYIKSLGNFTAVVSNQLPSSGTFVLAYKCRYASVPEDITDDPFFYKKMMYERDSYNNLSFFDKGLYGTSEWPNVSQAIIDGYISSNYKILNASTFKSIVKYLYDPVYTYTEDSETKSAYIPSVVKYNKDIFYELNIDKLLTIANRAGTTSNLINVEWLDYLYSNLNELALAKETINVGSNLTLETDTSGYASLLPDVEYTDPNLHVLFQASSWRGDTIPAYAQIGTGGKNMTDYFKLASRVLYPNVYMATFYDKKYEASEHDEMKYSEFITELENNGGKIYKRGTYSTKDLGFIDPVEDYNNYSEIDDMLFEVPLCEYDINKSITKGSNIFDLINVSFYQQTFTDISKELDDGITVTSNKTLNSNLFTTDNWTYTDSGKTSGALEVLTDSELGLVFSYQGELDLSTGTIPEISSITPLSDKHIPYYVIKVGNNTYANNSLLIYTRYKTADGNTYAKWVASEIYLAGCFGKEPYVVQVSTSSASNSYYSHVYSYDINGKADEATGQAKGSLVYNLLTRANYIVGRHSPTAYDSAINTSAYLAEASDSGTRTTEDVLSDDVPQIPLYVFTYYRGDYESSKADLHGMTNFDVVALVEYNGKYIACKMDKGNLLLRQDFNKLPYLEQSNLLAQIGNFDDYEGVVLYEDSVYNLYATSSGNASSLTELIDSGFVIENVAFNYITDKYISDGTTFTRMYDIVDNQQFKFTLPRNCVTEGSYNIKLFIDPKFLSDGYLYDAYLNAVDNSTTASLATVKFNVSKAPIFYNSDYGCFYETTDLYSDEGVLTEKNVKVVIRFEEQKYFKNIKILNGTYQVNLEQNEFSTETTKSAYFSKAASAFNISDMSLSDKIISMEEQYLRSEYDSSLESVMFSNYESVNGALYGFTDNDELFISANRSASTKRSDSVITSLIKSIYPATLDDDGTLELRDSNKAYDWADNTYDLEDVELKSVKVKKSITGSTYSAGRNAPDTSFKYYKNMLMFEGVIDPTDSTKIISDGSSEFTNALSKLSSGDSLVGLVTLESSDGDTRHSITTGASIAFTRLNWDNDTLVGVTSKGVIYAAAVTSLDSISTVTMKETGLSATPDTQDMTYACTDITFKDAQWFFTFKNSNDASMVYVVDSDFTSISEAFCNVQALTEPTVSGDTLKLPTILAGNYITVGDTMSGSLPIDTIKVKPADIALQAVNLQMLYAKEGDGSDGTVRYYTADDSNAPTSVRLNTTSINDDMIWATYTNNYPAYSKCIGYATVTEGQYVEADGDTDDSTQHRLVAAYGDYELYVHNTELFVKSPTALVDTNGDYTGDTSTNYHWKKATLPATADYTTQNLLSKTTDEAYDDVSGGVTFIKEFFTTDSAIAKLEDGSYRILDTTTITAAQYTSLSALINSIPAVLTYAQFQKLSVKSDGTYNTALPLVLSDGVLTVTNASGAAYYPTVTYCADGTTPDYYTDYLTYLSLIKKYETGYLDLEDMLKDGIYVESINFFSDNLALTLSNGKVASLPYTYLTKASDIEDGSNWVLSPAAANTEFESNGDGVEFLSVILDGETLSLPIEQTNAVTNIATINTTLVNGDFMFCGGHVDSYNSIVSTIKSQVSDSDYNTYYAQQVAQIAKFTNTSYKLPYIKFSSDQGASFTTINTATVCASLSKDVDITSMVIEDNVLYAFLQDSSGIMTQQLKVPLSKTGPIYDDIALVANYSTSYAGAITQEVSTGKIVYWASLGAHNDTDNDSFYNFDYIGSSTASLSQEVMVSSVTDTAFFVSSALLSSSDSNDSDPMIGVHVLMSFNTKLDVPDQLTYLRKDHLSKYLSSSGKLLVTSVEEVNDAGSADMVYSYRDTIWIPNSATYIATVTDDNDLGYPTLEEDEKTYNHTYYEYTEATAENGTTSYIPTYLTNDYGNNVVLCSKDGLQVITKNDTYGKRFMTITERVNEQNTDKAYAGTPTSSVDATNTDYSLMLDDATMTTLLNAGSFTLDAFSYSTDILKSDSSLQALPNDGPYFKAKFNSTFDFTTLASSLIDISAYVTDGIISTTADSTGNAPIENDTTISNLLTFIEDSEGDINTITNSFSTWFTDGSRPRFCAKKFHNSTAYYLYDNRYDVFVLSTVKYITSTARIPYVYFAGSKVLSNQSLVFDSTNTDTLDDSLLPVSSIYFNPKGYGGRRNNTDTEWTDYAPWDLDSAAFDSTQLLKNSAGDYVTMSDAYGKAITCNDGINTVAKGSSYTISASDITDDGLHSVTDLSGNILYQLYKLPKSTIEELHSTNFYAASAVLTPRFFRNNEQLSIEDILEMKYVYTYSTEDSDGNITTSTKEVDATGVATYDNATDLLTFSDDVDDPLTNTSYSSVYLKITFEVKSASGVYMTATSSFSYSANFVGYKAASEEASIFFYTDTSGNIKIDTSASSSSVTQKYTFSYKKGATLTCNDDTASITEVEGDTTSTYTVSITPTTNNIYVYDGDDNIIFNLPFFSYDTIRKFTFGSSTLYYCGDKEFSATSPDTYVSEIIGIKNAATGFTLSSCVVSQGYSTFTDTNGSDDGGYDTGSDGLPTSVTTGAINCTVAYSGTDIIAKGIKGSSYVMLPNYANFNALITDLGYYIKSGTIITPSDTSILSLNTDDSEVKINLLGLTAYDDCNEHYFRMKVLTVADQTLTADLMNDSDYYYEVTKDQLDVYTPNRVYFNADGLPTPPITIGTSIYNSENGYMYHTSNYVNNFNTKIYMCNAKGEYVKYSSLNGTLVETVLGDSTGNCLNDVKYGIDNRVCPRKPVYDSCSDWFKNNFYVEGTEINPLWQIVEVKPRINSKKEYYQQAKLMHYKKQFDGQALVEVTEDPYVAISNPIALTYSTSKGLTHIVDSDFLDKKNGILRIQFTATDDDYKTKTSFTKYGLNFSSSLNEKSFWNGTDTLDATIKLTYTVNSLKDFRSKIAKDTAIAQVTELGLFDKNHKLLAYATFPPIEYRTDLQHASFTCVVYQGNMVQQ